MFKSNLIFLFVLWLSAACCFNCKQQLMPDGEECLSEIQEEEALSSQETAVIPKEKWYESDIKVWYQGDINGLNDNGVTLLYVSVASDPLEDDKKYEQVKELLEDGADPNIFGKDNKCNPLYTAILKGDLEMVKLLLSYNADVLAQDEDGTTAICGCFKQPAILNLLLTHLGKIGQVDEKGLAPIHWAAKDGHICVISDLEERSALGDVNRKEPQFGYTPLHFAARRGYTEIVDILLASGADKTAKSKNGFTPLMLAIANRHEVLRDRLSPDGCDSGVIDVNKDWVCVCCQDGLLGIGETSLEQVQMQDKHLPVVPLHCGHRFHFRCIKNVLIGRIQSEQEKYRGGVVVPDQVDLVDQVDFQCPECRGTIDTTKAVRLMREMIPDESSLLNAVLSNETPKVRYLLENGANPNERNIEEGIAGITPLIASILEGNKEIFDLLIRYGADVNQNDAFLRTPLYWAAHHERRHADLHVFRTLVQHHADIHKKGYVDGDNDTPLDCCCVDESKNVLLEAGAVRYHYHPDDEKRSFGLTNAAERVKIAMSDNKKT